RRQDGRLAAVCGEVEDVAWIESRRIRLQEERAAGVEVGAAAVPGVLRVVGGADLEIGQTISIEIADADHLLAELVTSDAALEFVQLIAGRSGIEERRSGLREAVRGENVG